MFKRIAKLAIQSLVNRNWTLKKLFLVCRGVQEQATIMAKVWYCQLATAVDFFVLFCTVTQLLKLISKCNKAILLRIVEGSTLAEAAKPGSPEGTVVMAVWLLSAHYTGAFHTLSLQTYSFVHVCSSLHQNYLRLYIVSDFFFF